MTRPRVKSFFDPATYTVSHIASCPQTGRAAIIDSVLDFDQASGRISTRSADLLIDYVEANGLGVDWILETHIHADHLSAAPHLQNRVGGKIGIGAAVSDVQAVFGDLFDAGPTFAKDGSQFDHLFVDGEKFEIGEVAASILSTPGHTPACTVFVIGDAAFVGDTLFMPDFGTARCDFPGGSAEMLYQSIQKIFTLPDRTRLFMCHDYKAPGRDRFCWETTISDQKRSNIHVGDGCDEASFVKMRTERDATLSMPRLILPSVQVNMRAGNLPEARENGRRYLQLPLDEF